MPSINLLLMKIFKASSFNKNCVNQPECKNNFHNRWLIWILKVLSPKISISVCKIYLRLYSSTSTTGLFCSLSLHYQLHSISSINSTLQILKILPTLKPFSTYILHNWQEIITRSLNHPNQFFLETKTERVLVSFYSRNTSFKELQEIVTLCPPYPQLFKDTLNQFIDCLCQIGTLHICMESGYFLMDSGRQSYSICASQSIVVGVYVQLSPIKIKYG